MSFVLDGDVDTIYKSKVLSAEVLQMISDNQIMEKIMTLGRKSTDPPLLKCLVSFIWRLSKYC